MSADETWQPDSWDLAIGLYTLFEKQTFSTNIVPVYQSFYDEHIHR